MKQKEIKTKVPLEPSSNKKAKELKKKFKSQKKLRSINLSNISPEYAGGSKKSTKEKPKTNENTNQKSVKTKGQRYSCSNGCQNNKRSHTKRKTKDAESSESVEKPKIKVAEFSNVEELAKIFEVTSSEIIQICIELGMLVTKNQRMNWDIVELLADHFGFAPEKITDIGEESF